MAASHIIRCHPLWYLQSKTIFVSVFWELLSNDWSLHKLHCIASCLMNMYSNRVIDYYDITTLSQYTLYLCDFIHSLVTFNSINRLWIETCITCKQDLVQFQLWYVAVRHCITDSCDPWLVQGLSIILNLWPVNKYSWTVGKVDRPWLVACGT